MRINQGELAELIKDEAGVKAESYFCHKSDSMRITIVWGWSECILAHEHEQSYFVIESNSDEIFPGETISVNEILDIVL